jgi:DNA-directed RNA polymerase specialized sigma24 family protein
MADEHHVPLEPADTRPWREVVAQHEQSQRISAALVGIPAEYREAIVLRFHDELSLRKSAPSQARH